VKRFFHPHNDTIVGFYYLFYVLNCYMFRSYDHLHEKICFLENYSTDNKSAVFRILNIMDNYSDWFA
jgi:hypothetical protein